MIYRGKIGGFDILGKLKFSYRGRHDGGGAWHGDVSFNFPCPNVSVTSPNALKTIEFVTLSLKTIGLT